MMRVFEREQEIIEVADTFIGGQLGQYPTALMGAIFYAGDRLVAGTNSPEFDRARATRIVEKADKMCAAVGTPLVLDVICATPAQARAFIGFALEVSERPVLMDGTTPEVRRAGLERASELGALDRVIFNAVQETVLDRELAKVVTLGCESAVVMLVNSKDPTVKGKVKIARELVPRAKAAGFKNLLLDMAVLDIVDVGTSVVAIPLLKEEFGLPCGCSPTHTHITRWARAKEYTPKEQAAARVATASMLQSAGGDFIIFDIKATEVIPAMSMVDAELAYGARYFKVKPYAKGHPLYRVFQ
ncbi:MAG: hypothetical protein KQJ78_21710 [Deltaproteobacteria bacterium]|nr:hypothetical protein [Deltaproteobacteria bacterium]